MPVPAAPPRSCAFATEDTTGVKEIERRSFGYHLQVAADTERRKLPNSKSHSGRKHLQQQRVSQTSHRLRLVASRDREAGTDRPPCYLYLRPSVRLLSYPLFFHPISLLHPVFSHLSPSTVSSLLSHLYPSSLPLLFLFISPFSHSPRDREGGREREREREKGDRLYKEMEEREGGKNMERGRGWEGAWIGRIRIHVVHQLNTV